MRIKNLQTVHAVAAQASLDLQALRNMIAAKEHLFRPITMKKRGPARGERVVYEIHDSLKQVHRHVALWTSASWVAPDCVHGFLKGRSFVSHAAMHLGRPVVVTADIEDFFPSISAERVFDAFRFLGASEAVATLLTELCEFEGRLPAGTRCSPAISNVVCRDLDEAFSIFPNYSRYADDLAFSGQPNEVPSREMVAATLRKSQFALRDTSFHAAANPQQQYVTGLLVNHPHGPHVPRDVKHRLRQQVYYIQKYGLEAHCKRTNGGKPSTYMKWLDGKLNQIAMVEPKFAKPLLETLSSPEHDEQS